MENILYVILLCNIKYDKHFFDNHAACTAYIKCLFYHYLSLPTYMIYEATSSLTYQCQAF